MIATILVAAALSLPALPKQLPPKPKCRITCKLKKAAGFLVRAVFIDANGIQVQD